jgi:hypothetical protein
MKEYLIFLKNLFSGVFKKVSDNIKNNIKEFSNLISNKDTMKDALPELKKQFEKMNSNFENFTKENKSLSEYKKEIKNYFIEIYMILDSFSRKFSAEKYKPYNFYSNTNNPLFKKIFGYQNPEDFMKNLDAHITTLVKEKGKSSGMSDDELNKFDEEIKESLKIFEEETNTQGGTEGGTQGGTEGGTEGGTQSNVSDEIMTKFKDSMKKFISEDLLKPLSSQLEKSIKEGGDEAGGSQVQKIAKTIPDSVSNNLDSKKNIIKAISQINDKNTLIKIRDILGLSKDNTPL